MHFHQAHIGEYRGTTEEHILNKIQLWDANSLLIYILFDNCAGFNCYIMKRLLTMEIEKYQSRLCP